MKFNKNRDYKWDEAYGKLEQGATGLFMNNLIEKIYPSSEIDNLLIYHLPNKYVALQQDIWINIGALSLTELKQLVK